MSDDWVVQPVAGQFATKEYRCPGCDHTIRPGTPHVVAWPAHAVDHRRHWHTPCWQRRRG